MNFGTITDTLSWLKFSPLDGIRVKPKLHRRRRRIYESSYSRRNSQKVFMRTIYWNLASIVKNNHGIIERPLLVAQKQAESQNELHVEQKKRHQPSYWNLDRMISGSRILWMLLLSAKWPRPPGRREISKWTKIWRILVGPALFAEELGKRIFWLLRLKNRKSYMHQKHISEDWMRKKSW